MTNFQPPQYPSNSGNTNTVSIVVAILIAIVSVAASVATPEVRRYLNLDTRNESVHERNVAIPDTATVQPVVSNSTIVQQVTPINPQPQNPVVANTPVVITPAPLVEKRPATIQHKTVHRAYKPTSYQNNMTRAEWKESYFRNVKKGTYNVIVYSFDTVSSEKTRTSVLEKFETKYPGVMFKVFPTISSDGVSNERYAIEIGEGLTPRTADAIADKAKAMGMEDHYKNRQAWDVDDCQCEN